MGRVLVQADVKAIYRDVNRDEVETETLVKNVEQRIKEALKNEVEESDLDVRVTAKDG